MGYYIQTPEASNKAKQLEDLHGAILLPEPPKIENFPTKQAIICIVNNGNFEAAAFCYSLEELEVFLLEDGRPKLWMIMDKQRACTLTGYPYNVPSLKT